jgi:hypothetical protein
MWNTRELYAFAVFVMRVSNKHILIARYIVRRIIRRGSVRNKYEERKHGSQSSACAAAPMANDMPRLYHTFPPHLICSPNPLKEHF